MIAVKSSEQSRAVAAYYAKTRNVPSQNILLLDIPAATEITRDDWDRKVRPSVRSWLAKGGRLAKLKCLATVWDVPLKITATRNDSDVQRLIRYLEAERTARIETLNGFTDRLRELFGEAIPASGPLANDAPLNTIKQHLDTVFGGAQAAGANIADSEERTKTLSQLQAIYLRSVGLNMMVQSLGRQLQTGAQGANPSVRSEFDVSRGRALGLSEGRRAIESMPASLEREPLLLAMVQLSDGVFGSIIWIDDQLTSLAKNETYASFDSELALVAWPTYQLVRWQPNYNHYRYDASPIRRFRKSFMVSRIEAPTLAITRKIIDDAVATEKTGLQGKVYLDARGLAREGETPRAGDFQQSYDAALLNTQKILESASTLEVVLDTKQDLFAAGTAPDAAIYCGWYSLAKYVDAFEWKPGAIGYHMASGEATTLRNPESQVWCKRMLEEGVAVTLGPTNEPYITGFPRPDEFIPLVLSGKYTVVESFYRCNPFNSWTMVLVGDPLYSPFKSQPALDIGKLEPATKRVIEGTDADF